MKKILLTLSIIFLLTMMPSFVNAEEFVYEQNTEANLIIVCINNGFCSSSAICNASVFDPDSNVIKDNVQATQSVSLASYNITLNTSETSKLGEYKLAGFCKDGSVSKEVNYPFWITPNGTKITTPESRIYLILAFGVLILFLISFYFMIVTPYSNIIDNRGAVIQLTKLKYVKLGLILLTWVLFTWFLNILIGLSDNFVSLTMYYGFFGFMFQTMNLLAFPLGIVVMVISLFEIIKDANIQENIKKFGKG